MQAATHRSQPCSAPPQVHWADSEPRTAVSLDGVKLLHTLPGVLSPKTVVKFHFFFSVDRLLKNIQAKAYRYLS